MSELDLSKYEGADEGCHRGVFPSDCPTCRAKQDAHLLLVEVKQLRAARQAWAIRAAEESARADALLVAAERVYRDTMAGSVFAIDDLGVAIEAAKVKHGEVNNWDVLKTMSACNMDIGKLKALVTKIDRDVVDLARSRAQRHQFAACILRGVKQRLASLLAESEPTKAPEIAWLIESRLTPSPTWWTGSDWTRDSLKAVRFCRKQDAEAALATLPDKHVCFTSEHQWGLGPMRGPEEE